MAHIPCWTGRKRRKEEEEERGVEREEGGRKNGDKEKDVRKE